MINSNHVASVFKRNLWVVNRQIEGLSNEDCLIQPPFRGNCLNWVLGHLVASRQTVLELLGHEGINRKEEFVIYDYESEPVTAESEGILSLEVLIGLLEDSQRYLNDALEMISDEAWMKEINGKETKLWERVEFLSWHETYHVGQLEYLRQLAGTDDKVI